MKHEGVHLANGNSTKIRVVVMANGYLYWRHGLEAAMAGHMSAHVVLQIPGVMLLKALL